MQLWISWSLHIHLQFEVKEIEKSVSIEYNDETIEKLRI